jgi:hypothetical protein
MGNTLVQGSDRHACHAMSLLLHAAACCCLTAALRPADEGELALQRVELQGGGTAYLFRFPAGTELAPGASLQWPLWLHPSAPVALDFQLLWYYEAAGGADSSAGMKFRTLRMAHSVPVAPLLRVLPTVAPSSKDLYRYMLRLEVDNSRVRALVVVCVMV